MDMKSVLIKDTTREERKESYKKHWTVMILQDVRTAVDAACLGLEIPLQCMKII